MAIVVKSRSPLRIGGFSIFSVGVKLLDQRFQQRLRQKTQKCVGGYRDGPPLSPDEILPALKLVEDQAANDKVVRKHLSPVLMERLNELTQGKAMRAYQGILLANAQLAAQIAVERARVM